jgi:hypothetical protein
MANYQKIELMANYLKQDKDATYKMRIFETPFEELRFMDMYHKQHLANNESNKHCIYCENEKIESRFEILDL